MALPPLVKEFQRLIGVDHDLATVLGYGLGDDVVLVILRLLVGAMEQLADTIKAVNEAAVGLCATSGFGSRGQEASEFLAEESPEFTDCHVRQPGVF